MKHTVLFLIAICFCFVFSSNVNAQQRKRQQQPQQKVSKSQQSKEIPPASSTETQTDKVEGNKERIAYEKKPAMAPLVLTEKISKVLDASRKLTERAVDTQATLQMDQYKNLNKSSQSTELWWVFIMEEPADRVTKLYSLPDPPPYTSWGASMAASFGRDRVIVTPTSTRGLVAFQRFQDVVSNLGVGSHIRFDPEKWVDFYGERFRKGGFIVSAGGLRFLEDTEVLINDESWVLSGDMWLSSKPAKSEKTESTSKPDSKKLAVKEPPPNLVEVIVPAELMLDWQMFLLNTNGRIAFFTSQNNPLRSLEDIKNPEKEVAIGDLSFERPLRTLLAAMGFVDKNFLVIGTGFYSTLFYKLDSLKLFLAPNRPNLEKEILEKGGGLRVMFILAGADEKKAKDYAVAKSSNTGRRTGFNVYLGTIPSYTESKDGLVIDGVREDSPAANAGLKAGDKIVKMGQREVKNVSDYTYALGEMKAGQEYEVVVIRGGERVTLKIMPTDRN